MLVLTRKPGEQIIIADNIRITVVALGHGRVKIGIEAPPNVSIDRQEVHDRKQVEEAVASAVSQPVVVNTEPPTVHNRIAGKLPQVPPSAPNAATKASDYRTKPR